MHCGYPRHNNGAAAHAVVGCDYASGLNVLGVAFLINTGDGVVHRFWALGDFEVGREAAARGVDAVRAGQRVSCRGRILFLMSVPTMRISWSKGSYCSNDRSDNALCPEAHKEEVGGVVGAGSKDGGQKAQSER